MYKTKIRCGGLYGTQSRVLAREIPVLGTIIQHRIHGRVHVGAFFPVDSSDEAIRVKKFVRNDS